MFFNPNLPEVNAEGPLSPDCGFVAYFPGNLCRNDMKIFHSYHNNNVRQLICIPRKQSDRQTQSYNYVPDILSMHS